MLGLNINEFIKEKITGRKNSYFDDDIASNHKQLAREINGSRVLVIGGAGTIGSSFIYALLHFDPSRLVVVDYSENGLTELTRTLRSRTDINVPSEYITYPFDFGGDIFSKLIEQENFDIVACFAAHKHVRSEKDHLAIEAMYHNNVVNTHRLLQLLSAPEVKHFFSVSTDKAANPVNVMGATKKIMEHVLLAHSTRLKITTARFANVAFSNGSLLDGFIYRMMKRQPLSAPSDVRRYFVSPEESGQLCLLACILGNSGDIFFPKLSEDDMMTFSSIAEDFLRALGLVPFYCKTEDEAKIKAMEWTSDKTHYPVYFFQSDTSGEKKYEEFFTNTDTLAFDKFSALGVIEHSEKLSMDILQSMLNDFENSFQSKNIRKQDIIALLTQYLPDFEHIETGKSLDQKM